MPRSLSKCDQSLSPHESRLESAGQERRLKMEQRMAPAAAQSSPAVRKAYSAIFHENQNSLFLRLVQSLRLNQTYENCVPNLLVLKFFSQSLLLVLFHF